MALHALGSNGLIPLSLSLYSCRTIVELAIPCDKPGKRVFEGFTVGFHLRKWEISCFYVPPSLRSGVALARTTQSGLFFISRTVIHPAFPPAFILFSYLLSISFAN
nr:AT4G36440-like protein [Ipomoea batatas]